MDQHNERAIVAISKFLDRSHKAIVASIFTYDFARSAEKMAEPSCRGNDNEAWKHGPYLESPAGQPNIDRSFPCILRGSAEFNFVMGFVTGHDYSSKSNAQIVVSLPLKNENSSRIEPVVAKLAIIEQFEIFKEFLATFDGPYNERHSKLWKGRVEQAVLASVTRLTIRRNELTHDSDHSLPSIREAVKYFHKVQELAPILFRARKGVDNISTK